MNKQRLAQEIIRVANRDGTVEVAAGAWLSTIGFMLEEQKEWEGTDDKLLSFDFTTAPYWIVTDNGKILAVNGANDDTLLDAIQE